MSTDPVVAATYEYDAFARLAALTHKLGAGENTTGDPNDVVAGYEYAYDAAGRITGFTNTQHSAETSTNSYDQTNQLLGSDRSGGGNDESYDYDANGNRDSSGYVTDVHNRTTEDTDFTYAYDAEGYRIAKTRKSGTTDDHFVEYEWDFRNRLTAVVFKDNGGVITKRIEYAYDALDHLVVRRVDTSDNFTMADAAVESYVYDGNQVVLTFVGTISASTLDRRYVWGPQVDQLLFQETDALALTMALGDHQQTVRDVVDVDGALVAHIAYDSFGNVISAVDGSSTPFTDITTVTPFLYTGRYLDFATGLQNNWHRWYDPQLGKWLSDDPIGFAAGDTNLSGYVGNGPTNGIDPDGLKQLAANIPATPVAVRKANLIELIGKEENIHKNSAYYNAMGVSKFFNLMRDTINTHVNDVVENAWFQGSALANWDPTFKNIELPGTIGNAPVSTVIHETVHAYNHWKHPNTYAANSSLDEGMAYGTENMLKAYGKLRQFEQEVEFISKKHAAKERDYVSRAEVCAYVQVAWRRTWSLNSGIPASLFAGGETAITFKPTLFGSKDRGFEDDDYDNIESVLGLILREDKAREVYVPWVEQTMGFHVPLPK